jgi:hypothetical protein
LLDNNYQWINIKISDLLTKTSALTEGAIFSCPQWRSMKMNRKLDGPEVAAENNGNHLRQENSVIISGDSLDGSSEKEKTAPPVLPHPPRSSTLSMVFNFGKWDDKWFIVMFISAAFMGSILNYSIFLCTTLNSALTTAVVGALKNIAVTYIGMVLFADYAFSWVNFIGINISIAGSLYYTYMTIFKGVTGFGAG